MDTPCPGSCRPELSRVFLHCTSCPLALTSPRNRRDLYSTEGAAGSGCWNVPQASRLFLSSHQPASALGALGRWPGKGQEKTPENIPGAAVGGLRAWPTFSRPAARECSCLSSPRDPRAQPPRPAPGPPDCCFLPTEKQNNPFHHFPSNPKADPEKLWITQRSRHSKTKPCRGTRAARLSSETL